MNKPKDDPRKKLDDVLKRFLSNDADAGEADKDKAENADAEVDADHESK